MTAVYKRELRSYFSSMIGYVFIAVVVFSIGIYFMANNLFYGAPRCSLTLTNVMVVFLVAIPVLTMKSMAEERRSRTDQLLLTAPVSLTAVVLGKYLAMVTVLAWHSGQVQSSGCSRLLFRRNPYDRGAFLLLL